jgi:para-nitrobenzyl esterase
MTLVISKDIKLKNDVLKNQRTILSPLLKHSINPSYATLDYNVPFVRKAVGIAAVAAVTTVLGVIAVKKLLE